MPQKITKKKNNNSQNAVEVFLGHSNVTEQLQQWQADSRRLRVNVYLQY